MEHAVSRRLQQELGFECPLTFLYKFKYHAQYGAVGAEHEYCWVYYGRYGGAVNVNVNEVADWRFVGIGALESELEWPQRPAPYHRRRRRYGAGRCGHSTRGWEQQVFDQ